MTHENMPKAHIDAHWTGGSVLPEAWRRFFFWNIFRRGFHALFPLLSSHITVANRKNAHILVRIWSGLVVFVIAETLRIFPEEKMSADELDVLSSAFRGLGRRSPLWKKHFFL